jgi:hypothetical protein
MGVKGFDRLESLGLAFFALLLGPTDRLPIRRKNQSRANTNEPKKGMLVLNANLGDALAKKLGNNPVVLMRGHGDTVVGGLVREATVRTLYTHIDAQAQSASMALNPKITALNASELAVNAQENFDADRP